MSEISFERVPGDDDLPLPSYATGSAAGMDLRAFLPDGPVTFQHGDLKIISTGFHVELPDGTEMQVRPRPGLSLKHGFILPNSPGTVDSDYRGYLSGVQQQFNGLERAGLLRCLRGRLASKMEEGWWARKPAATRS